MALAPIEDILEDLQAGRVVVLVDDERRENEGDFGDLVVFEMLDGNGAAVGVEAAASVTGTGQRPGPERLTVDGVEGFDNVTEELETIYGCGSKQTFGGLVMPRAVFGRPDILYIANDFTPDCAFELVPDTVPSFDAPLGWDEALSSVMFSMGVDFTFTSEAGDILAIVTNPGWQFLVTFPADGAPSTRTVLSGESLGYYGWGALFLDGDNDGDRDLVQALENQAGEFATVTAIETGFESLGQAYPLPSAIGTALVRITQEGLSNVYRHAGASRVEVKLVYHEGSVELHIQDDGGSFDQAAAPAGRGLSNMTQRALELDGVLEIDASVGRGVRVKVVLPVKSHDKTSEKGNAETAKN